MTMLIECTTTDDEGIARFFGVGPGIYTSNAYAPGYESEGTTFEYDPIEDIFNGGTGIDDAFGADVIQSLDPDFVPIG